MFKYGSVITWCILCSVVFFGQNLQKLLNQADAVATVKRYENGFIMNPICMSPEDRIHDLDAVKQAHGYSSVPITANGQLGGRLLGIVTNRDIDLVEDRHMLLRDVMTTQLTVGIEPISLQVRKRASSKYQPTGKEKSFF